LYKIFYAAEDHFKNVLGRSNNENYKPWKNQFAPRNPHSPFGDFPKEQFLREKLAEKKHEPNFEMTLSGSLNKHERKRGTGGKCVSTLEKKKNFDPLAPKSGAFLKRDVPLSEFRRYYDRGDLPIRVDHQSSSPKLLWQVSA
jgi:hypothetical protein